MDEDDPVTVERTTGVDGLIEAEGVKTGIELGQEDVAKSSGPLLLFGDVVVAGEDDESG